MACIIKKRNKYSTYYVIAESARVNGKPRIIKQHYLGTIDKLLAISQGHPEREQPRQIDCLDAGGVAALFTVAQELGIAEIVNRHASKRNQGMTVGDYLLIATLNRALAPSSKAQIASWAQGTALPLLMKIDTNKLDSQNFWDHFDKLDQKVVNRIGDEIAQRALELEKVPLDCLVYDTSNYFNYWDVLTPSELVRYTKSKGGKDSLRHIGLAIAVDRDWGMPLFHRLYPAHTHDSKVFSQLLDDMFVQISQAVSDKRGITFVFDKGNNSQDAIARLDESRHHFIGSRSPYHHSDLCQIPLESYVSVDIPDIGELPVYETQQDLYGSPRRLIVVYNAATYARQCHRLERQLDRAKQELSQFKKQARRADRRRTVDSITKQAQAICINHRVSGLLNIDVHQEVDGTYRISAQKNLPAIEDLKMRFGKQILFTNRQTLSTQDIIRIYRDRAIVEDAFRITKSDLWVKMNPAFHWTDSKIRVHALTCVLALLLVRILHKRARTNGFEHGAERMLHLLSTIRTAMVYYPQSKKPQRQICHLSPQQQVLLSQLNLKIPHDR